MAKVLVLFHSNTGNTAKMAVQVAAGAQGVPGTEVRSKSIDEATKEDLAWCDGIALGAATNLGSVPWQMKKWWDTLPDEVWQSLDGKLGCAFSSSGGWGGGTELACLELLIILMNHGLMVFGVTDYVGKKHTAHYGAVLAGEPRTENEIASCKRLGQRLAEWIAVHVDGRKELHPIAQGYKRGSQH